MRRVPAAITDTSVDGGSPYGSHSRQGAVIVPRCLFFVEETENPAVVQAGQTVTVNPRRGSQDKEPWRSLDLAAITGQTIGTQHLYDVHLGETLLPYATLDPLKAILPLQTGETGLPADTEGVGGVNLGALGQRMRDRWRTVSRLWEENKAEANKMDLVGAVGLLRQTLGAIEWRTESKRQAFPRRLYTKSGEPTAALLRR